MPAKVYNLNDTRWGGTSQGGSHSDALDAILADIPNGGIIEIPPIGILPDGYTFSRSHTITKPITVRGPLSWGGYADWLTYTGTGTFLNINQEGVHVDGLGIKTTTGAIAIEAMQSASSVGFELSRCNIVGFSASCLKTNTFYGRMENLYFQGKAGGSGAFVDATINFNAWSVDNVRCVYGPADMYTAFDINSGASGTSSGSTIQGVWVDGAPTGVTCFKFRTGSHAMTMLGNRFEVNGATCIAQHDNCQGLVILGGQCVGASSLPSAKLISIAGRGSHISGILLGEATNGIYYEATADRHFVGPREIIGTVTNPVAGTLAGVKDYLSI